MYSFDEMYQRENYRNHAQLLTPEMSPFKNCDPKKFSKPKKAIFSKFKREVEKRVEKALSIFKTFRDKRTEKNRNAAQINRSEQAKQIKATFGEQFGELQKCLGIVCGSYATQLNEIPKVEAKLQTLFEQANIKYTHENAMKIWQTIK